MLIAFGGTSAMGQDVAVANTEYYFSGGQRIELERSRDWIAVRLRDPASNLADAAALNAIDLAGRRNLNRHGLALLPLRGELTAGMRRNLVADLARLPEINLVAQVYRAEGALMIVTDEFVVRFADGIPESQLASINRRHGVEIVRKLLRSDDAYVLRVVEGDALATANAYQNLDEVVYAHPDFVRVIPPRPGDMPPSEGRIVIAPDGSVLPPGTPIEKGRNDLTVVEPASATLPSPLEGSAPKVSPPSVTRVAIKNEGFEGAFPNGWALFGDPSWGDVSYRAYTGFKSGYCVGSRVSPPGPYPADASAWMVFGPFSLSDALDARVALQAWIETESGWDYLWVTASVNGSQFYGRRWSGNWANASGGDGWMNIALDLKRVPTLGDLRGESQVWVGFFFESDSVYNYEGAFVDDIVLEKITGGYESLTSDEFDHLQWSLANNEQLWGHAGADIRAVDAWDVTHGSDSITIAVLDEGVDLTHPDLAGKLVTGYDATDGGGSGGPSGDDAHGTGCAGIAAAITDNVLGVAGIAREAKIMPVRIGYDDGTGAWATSDSWIADAIDWAVAHGADVLSNSWGGGSPATVIDDAIDDARENGRGGLGAVVVFAAGNDNGPVHYPGSLATVLTVAATSPCDERKAPSSCDGEFWWGSNYGPEIDIAAPGVHMYTTDISGTSGYDSGDYHYNFNGTSSATPVVAGAAALLLGQDPSMTAAEVEAQLMATADDLLAPGWDQETGFGRVNAYRALTETPPTCYALTLSHTGLGSDPALTPTSSPGCAAGAFFEGETVTLSAMPAPGWVVGGWSGTDDDGSTSATNTLTMPGSPSAAGVHYVQIPCYSLVLSHSGSGGDPSPDPVASPGCDPNSYHAGEVVGLTAAPAAGWAVNGWSGTDADASVAPVNTVTIPAATRAASVEYVVIPGGCYALSRRHSGSGADPIPTPWFSSGCPGSTYTAGEAVSLTGNPSDGWMVGGWTGTDDDGSFLWTNTVQMPAANHTARIRYVTPTLVKDIRPGPQGSFNRDDFTIVSYTEPTSIGSTLYFAANDGVHGMELWKSDGTEAGTVLVKDIWPGESSAFPWSESMTWFSQTFVNVGGTLFFVARDGVHNYEVWKSDGTAAGTVMVKDIYDSFDVVPHNLTAVNGTLYFSHSDGTHGVELWKSNGTGAGTVMVKDINPGAGDSDPGELAEYNGILVFSANDGTHGSEPWISDGTGPGTMILKDVNTESGSYPSEFTQVGSTLFFSARDGDINYELWKSDGTAAGTVMVKDIAPDWYGSSPSEFEAMNGTLFFEADDSEHGLELWKSDGTEAGTVMVKDIWPGSEYSVPGSCPGFMTNVNGSILFKANTPDQGDWGGELWKSDGTEAGTVMVKDIYPNPNPINMWPTELEEAGGSLVFSADDAVHGRELWWSDGTGARTRMVADINVGGNGSNPDWIVDGAGVVFFRPFEGTYGREIWALVDPSDCHLLTVGHTGMGSDPVMDPSQSAGCDQGMFETGEVVTLTANPDTGWVVGSWTGSDNDGSTSTVNQVTMPSIDRDVIVHYTAPPIFVDGFESGDTTEWSQSVGQ
jgi:ELWxxDGT repeat protein